MQNLVTDFLESFHTCLLLVHPEIHSLDSAAADLLSAYSWARIRIGQELSDLLLTEAPQRRSRRVRQWMPGRLRELSPGPVLCTEIDLLFEPTLEVNPLSLLCDASRATRLVVTWPGSYQDNTLAYAIPDHSHYRTWRKPEIPIVTLE